MEYVVALVVVVIVLCGASFLSGYRLHALRSSQRPMEILVRPHTRETMEQHPITQQLKAEVTDASFARPDLPNSGVKWDQ